MKSLVVIPTYNEFLNVPIIYKKIRNKNKNLDILFIDDNSPDKTSKVIKSIINKDKKVFLIIRNKKKGIGSAHKLSFLWAKKNSYSYVITIDADLSHNPDLIKRMLKLMKSKHVIVTGRFLKKNTLDEWSFVRKLITHTRHYVIKKLFKIPYDSSGAFRCYNLDKINIKDLILAKDNGYSFFWESLIILHYKKYIIKEIPMKQPVRIYGSSKITSKDIFRAISYIIYFYFYVKLFVKFNNKK